MAKPRSRSSGAAAEIARRYGAEHRHSGPRLGHGHCAGRIAIFPRPGALNPPAATATPSTGPSRVSFEVQPGQVQLRLSVESADAEVLDSEVRELTIPDLTSAETLLSTPLVFRGRTLPEFQRLKAYPQAVPTPAREFSRTERVFVRATAAAGGTNPRSRETAEPCRPGDGRSHGLAATISEWIARHRSVALVASARRVCRRDYRDRRRRPGQGTRRLPGHGLIHAVRPGADVDRRRRCGTIRPAAIAWCPWCAGHARRGGAGPQRSAACDADPVGFCGHRAERRRGR